MSTRRLRTVCFGNRVAPPIGSCVAVPQSGQTGFRVVTMNKLRGFEALVVIEE